MKLYRILVVDDEPEIADAVTELCRDGLCGVEVRTAYMGRKALEILQNEPVDLLLTDISMPGITGFDLLEHIREQGLACRVVFLTGFRDFEYVYKAAQSPNVSYLIKTEPDERIVECVQRVLEELSETKEQTEMLSRAQKQLQELAPVIAKEFLGRILRGETGAAELDTDTFARFGMPFVPQAQVGLVLGRFDRFDVDSSTLKKYQSTYALKDLLDEQMQEKVVMMSLVNQEYQLAAVFQREDGIGLEQAANWLRRVQENCRLEFGQTVSFAVASEYFPFAELAENYTDLNHLLCLNGGQTGGLLLYGQEKGETPPTGRMPDLTGQYHQLAQDLNYRNEAHFFKTFQGLAERLSSFESRYSLHAQEIYGNISMVLMTFLNNNGLNEQIAFKTATYKLMRVDEHADWQEASRYLHGVGRAIFEVLSEEQAQQRSTVDAIHAYVEANLGDFSLNALADVLHFNPSYLSRLYKNSTGEKLQDYIQSRKLQMAAECLENSNEKINAIGSKIGFDTPQSFARFFRRLTGRSPQEFRQEAGKSAD